MAVINTQISSGNGLPAGSNSSAQAVAVTGAFDFAFSQTNSEPFIGAGGGSQSIVLTAQGAGTVNGTDNSNKVAHGVKLGINITSVTGSLQVTIQGKDPGSLQYYTILQSAAIAATGFTLLTVFPGATAAANASANDQLPFTWRVIYTVVTGPVTATISASLLV